MNKSRWLCMDCSKDIFVEGYCMLRNKRWRQLVPRSQRHGMLCAACISKRLGRALQADDYHDSPTVDSSDPDERPMDLDDYGIVDTLTLPMVTAIDQGLIEGVTTLCPRRVGSMIRKFVEYSPAAIPGLPDYYYLNRIERMVDSGVLEISREVEHPMQCEVRLAPKDR